MDLGNDQVPVYRPSCRPAQRKGIPAIPKGCGYLKRLCDRFLGVLTLKERNALGRLVEHDLSSELRVGSLCSGTDCHALVLQGFARSVEEMIGVHLDVDHMFSAEKSPRKQ